MNLVSSERFSVKTKIAALMFNVTCATEQSTKHTNYEHMLPQKPLKKRLMVSFLFFFWKNQSFYVRNDNVVSLLSYCNCFNCFFLSVTLHTDLVI